MYKGHIDRLVFHGEVAPRFLLTLNSTQWTVLEPSLRQRLVDLDSAAPLEALPSGMVTIDAIARKLALSRHRLQRRIREGSSYQKTLQDTRESLARNYPEKTEFPATEISFLLGFDESNSFYRAFWTRIGMTPDSVCRPTKNARPLCKSIRDPGEKCVANGASDKPARL